LRRTCRDTNVICGWASASKKSALRRWASRFSSRVSIEPTSTVTDSRVCSGRAGS
jgi:hypothetical protein